MIRLADLSDFQLGACNRWTLPDGSVKLALPHVIPWYATPNTAAEGSDYVVEDNEVGTPAEYDFVCKVVSYTGYTPGTILQIQWPDGRYLSNPGLDFFSFVGTGRRGRLISPHKFCPKSSKIKINVDNSLVTAFGTFSPIELFFEGVILIDLVSS